MHWYLGIDCTTRGCDATNVIKYVGPVEDWPNGPDFDMTFPSPLTVKCPTCGEIRDYTLSDLKPQQIPKAPPSGFKNPF